MRRALSGLEQRLQPWLAPLFLLALCVLAYGLWAPRLGWYWDDFPIGWIARTFGADGLERYFSTVRPVWGLVYRLTTGLLGAHPLAWQVFAILWRWITGLAFWWLLRLVWPRRGDFAVWAGGLFVVYPGFSQQFIALVYSHFFIVLAAFLTSLALTISALRKPRMFWPLTGLAWLLGLFNLLAMEYFFFLELVRPLLVWIVLGEARPDAGQPAPAAEPGTAVQSLRSEYAASLSRPARLLRALGVWLPYAASLLGVILWRSFFFSSGLYQPVFTGMLRSDPLGALRYLAGRVAGDAWLAVVQVWQNAFRLPTGEELTPNLMLIYWGVAASAALTALVYAWLSRKPAAADQAKTGRSFGGALLVGLACLLVSGVPFWLTNLPLNVSFHFDRFNLAYMSAAVLVAVGLVFLVPLPRWARVVPLALALGMCVGYQYQQAVVYIRDWNVQQRMFWQLAWRMPGLQPGTMLLSNELPVKHYSDNSLTAAVNWVFNPENRTEQMGYALFYPTVRSGNLLKALEPGLPVELDYLAASFHGNTSQAVAFYYHPPGCARVLDPEVERDNYTLPLYLRRAMVLSSTRPILDEDSAELPAGSPSLPAALFGVQSTSSWCYYFEKADLARQRQDWQQVVALSEEGFASGDYPNDPTERLPAIEGYAHLGDWQNALAQSRLTAGVAPVYEMVVCRLWERIRRDAPPGTGRDDAVGSIWAEYRCDEPRQEPIPDPTLEGNP